MIRAGVSGQVEQFALQVGDIVNPFMRAAGLEPSAAGVAAAYGELADGLVVDAADPGPDPAVRGLAVRRFDTLMEGAAGRRRVAEATLAFAATLSG